MSSYKQIKNFGQNTNPACGGSNDPLTYCLVDSLDKNFLHAPLGQQYGPRSDMCQNYMAQRCALEWDGFCEYYYRQYGENGEWPAGREWPNRGVVGQPVQVTKMTLGDQLLQNTAARKYCDFSNCVKECVSFDPTNPDSPKVTIFKDSKECFPICRIKNPETIDRDPVMDRALANPTVAGQTLANICNTSRREGTNLLGTKIGDFCSRYHEYMDTI